MNLSDLLNSDMTTLSRYARQGFDWWVGELSSLLPAGLLGGRELAAWHRYERGEVLVASQRGADTLVIPRDLCLVRSLTLPRMSEADARAMIALDLDRIMPVAPDSIVTGSRIAGPGAQPDTVEVRVGALPLARAREIAAAALAAGAVPAHLGPLDETGRRLEFDLAPALRSVGLLPPRPRVARAWWIAVAILALVNIGLAVLRDQQQVDRLQALVDQQSGALTAVRRIEDRLRGNAAVIEALNRRREEHQPLRVLAAVEAALPDKAWVQRLEWNAGRLRLTGYAAQGVNVVAALKTSGRFANVRAARAEVLSENQNGKPFDLSAGAPSAVAAAEEPAPFTADPASTGARP